MGGRLPSSSDETLLDKRKNIGNLLTARHCLNGSQDGRHVKCLFRIETSND
jgi:hypothetical protein